VILTPTDQKKIEIGRVNLQDMCTFNNFINSHGLVEMPFLRASLHLE
jgi:hypothetical protein